ALDDLIADLDHAARAERVGLARPAQGGLRALMALRQRAWGPAGLDGFRVRDSGVYRLKGLPAQLPDVTQRFAQHLRHRTPPLSASPIRVGAHPASRDVRGPGWESARRRRWARPIGLSGNVASLGFPQAKTSSTERTFRAKSLQSAN